MTYIKNFGEISKNDIKTVGGKGASLGELINAGIPVPPGFVITIEVFKNFKNKEIPQEIIDEILNAFDNLRTQRVAVRSSAVGEDSKTASWAGQLESYLNVSKDNLIDALKDCWKSIKSERAILYAKTNNIPQEKLAVAVVVQKMVESQASGVVFTVNPVTQDKNQMMIEAAYGLGEMLVQGLITPDNYALDKKTLEIKNKTLNNQDKMLIFIGGENREVETSQEKIGKQVISDEEIKQLGKLAKRIEDHYGNPQDIEWAFEKDNFYILQSRPITTLD